jgi:hypothetical protein
MIIAVTNNATTKRPYQKKFKIFIFLQFVSNGIDRTPKSFDGVFQTASFGEFWRGKLKNYLQNERKNF